MKEQKDNQITNNKVPERKNTKVISLLLCSYQSCTILDTNGIIKHYGYAWKCGEESIGIHPLETNTSTSWLMVVKCPTTFDNNQTNVTKIMDYADLHRASRFEILLSSLPI